jgi:outer membrane protein assembly factor BamE (lipoprotein component of BamABCDE complex)
MQFRPFFSAIVMTALFTSGCTNVYHTHGQVIPEENLAMLEVGKNDKQDVRRYLGSPSSVSTFNDNEWLYITSKTVDKPLRPGGLLEREILIVNFDDSGKVAQIQKKDVSESRQIEPADKTTGTQGQSMGVIDQMIDNLGRGFGSQ